MTTIIGKQIHLCVPRVMIFYVDVPGEAEISDFTNFVFVD